MVTFSHIQNQGEILSGTSWRFPNTKTSKETERMHLQARCIQIHIHRDFDYLLNFSMEI